MVTLTTPGQGRGAWPGRGTGGTLSLDGKGPGRFYRAPAPGVSAEMPGRVAALQIKAGKPVDVNDYAVYQAVRAIQARVGATVDGVFGSETGQAVTAWQALAGLAADGVFGPASAKVMFRPVITATAGRAAGAHPRLGFLTGGHIGYESGFDPGAVGVTTPVDLGLGQINGPSHPTMTAEQRLDPLASIEFVVGLVESNLDAFTNERDGIAAYNLGQGGCRSWIRAGRPQFWGSHDVPKYINAILTTAATV